MLIDMLFNPDDVNRFTPEDWEHHFARKRVDWPGFNLDGIRRVAQLAEENGDKVLAERARLAAHRRAQT